MPIDFLEKIPKKNKLASVLLDAELQQGTWFFKLWWMMNRLNKLLSQQHFYVWQRPDFVSFNSCCHHYWFIILQPWDLLLIIGKICRHDKACGISLRPHYIFRLSSTDIDRDTRRQIDKYVVKDNKEKHRWR